MLRNPASRARSTRSRASCCARALRRAAESCVALPRARAVVFPDVFDRAAVFLEPEADLALLAVDRALEDLFADAVFEGVAFAAFFFCAAAGVAASAPVEKIPTNDAKRINDIVGDIVDDSKAAHARAGMLIILLSPQSVEFYGRNCRRHTRRRQLVLVVLLL